MQIVKLSLNKKQRKQCHTLQLEAGRCYSDMLAAHVASRQGVWLTESELKSEFKGRYNLYSQSIQAIAEKIIANIKSTKSNIEREMAKQGYTDWQFPYLPKKVYSVTWKEECIRFKDDKLVLSNGRGNPNLVLSLPLKYRDAKIAMAELVLKNQTYYLHITVDTGKINPPIRNGTRCAGLDLGEIHIGSVSLDTGETLLVSGRQLRSIKQKRNKSRKQIGQKIRNKQSLSKDKSVASKRQQRLEESQEKHRRRFERQQRDILHKASRQVVNFCADNKISTLYYGDCHDIAQKGKNSKQHNDRLSQWAQGQFINYVTYKDKEFGISTKMIGEEYSSKTCSACTHVKKSSVQGRTYICSECNAVLHRDANGSCNICSKGKFGTFGKVTPKSVKYLQPVFIRGCSRPSEARLVALKPPVTQL